MNTNASPPANGLKSATPNIWLFRGALATCQRVWPTLAVRAAAKLFGTPLPPKWTNRPSKWESDWHVTECPFEGSAITLYSMPVPTQAPSAVLVHGWGGHAGQMRRMGEALAQSGLRPVILEMPAHGRSAGFTTSLPQFVRGIEYIISGLRCEGHSVRLLAAHSLGASAAAFAVSRGAPVERLALIAPAASPLRYTRYFAQMLGLDEVTRSLMQKRIESREGMLMRMFEPAEVGPRISLPVLIVHDRQDPINAFCDGQEFAREIRGSTLVATEGLGHRRLLQDPEVLTRVGIFGT